MKRSNEKMPDAFSLLMGVTKKKKGSSRFVPCPAGCGKYIAEFEINAHLDSCIQSSSEETSAKKRARVSSVPQSVDGVLSTNSRERTHSNVAAEANQGPLVQPEQNNAFSHMMKRSKHVFSTAEPQKFFQRFHLNADGTVSLTCYNANPGLHQPEDTKWSATVTVKEKISATEVSVQKPRLIELIVSSSIDTATKKPRLVRRHTRLSVPVLKSILQKSIRRRKPLPSVRVAMELADKSMDDLLRRLPIIMLEDSTLHPCLPFLTWLMVAHSKDFDLPSNLMTKLLCIVYEICSCPWQDHLGDYLSSNDEISIFSFHKPGANNMLDENHVAIWSMLLRAQYGGMGGDIRMLREYAVAWNERFSGGDIPDFITSKLCTGLSGLDKAQWDSIPVILHQSARRQSICRVGPICHEGILSLTITDITVEGVDFHCSGVLETILSDRELLETCYSRLNSLVDCDGLDPMPLDMSSDSRRQWLEAILKKSIWNYSAGVNRRLSLTGKVLTTDGKDVLKKRFWDELISPRVKAYAEKYVRQRL